MPINLILRVRFNVPKFICPVDQVTIFSVSDGTLRHVELIQQIPQLQMCFG